MLKKRIIFTLLYCDGFFVQSRNFDIQRVGDLNWLIKQYGIDNISYFIDELIIIDISKKKKNKKKFISTLKKISKFFFIPITIGGGIKSFSDASLLLHNGADKILMNFPFNKKYKVVKQISSVFGAQSIVAAVDIKKNSNNMYAIFVNNGNEEIKKKPKQYFNEVSQLLYGELLINSIDQDGTGNGPDLKILKLVPKKFNKPIILSGGYGNEFHFEQALLNKKIEAVATANLFNFVGDGFKLARESLLKKKFNLVKWDPKTLKSLAKK